MAISDIEILGMASYAPGEPIENGELKKLAAVEFDSQKIESKLGIKRRHIARLRGLQESTADFAEKAARKAITDARLATSDIDLFIVGTDTPEYISPATSLLIQGRIQQGERFGMAFDVGASCASFTTAFHIANSLMQTTPFIRHALVVGVYNMPAFVREGDSFGYSIFADGAGAVVLGPSKNGGKYIGGQGIVDGTQWDFIGVYAGGTKRPVTQTILEQKNYGLENLKPLPGDRNVKLWPRTIDELLKKHQLTVNDIDHFLFTQINRSVIEKVMQCLNLPMEKTTCVMDRYGYTGSGCIPMAFHQAVLEKKIKKGDTVLFVASGSGFAVCANLFVY